MPHITFVLRYDDFEALQGAPLCDALFASMRSGELVAGIPAHVCAVSHSNEMSRAEALEELALRHDLEDEVDEINDVAFGAVAANATA